MKTLDMYELEAQMEEARIEQSQLCAGFDIIASLVGMVKDDGKYQVHEDAAYQARILDASVKLGAPMPAHINSLPLTLGEYSPEALKVRIKETAARVWKAISEAAIRLAKLTQSWYRKLSEWLMSLMAKTQDAIPGITARLDAHEAAGKDYGLHDGDKVSDEILQQMKDINNGETLVFTTPSGHYIARKDLERNITLMDAGFASKEFKDAFRAVLAFADPRNLSDASVDLKERLGLLLNDSYLGEYLAHLEDMTNIATREELESFIDNHANTSAKGVETFLKDTGIERSPKIAVGKAYDTVALSGKECVTLNIYKTGMLHHIRAMRKPSTPSKLDLDMITLDELSQVNACLVEYAHAHEVILARTTRIDDFKLGKVGNDASTLKELEQRLLKITPERMAADIRPIRIANKQMANILEGWSSYYKSIADVGVGMVRDSAPVQSVINRVAQMDKLVK